MAAAAFLTRRMGAAAGRMVVVVATAGISSFLSRARNSGRGRSPSRRSMSRCEYLGMGASHARAQLVQRAELQLLDRAFALADARRGLADAALVDEALHDDGALIARQLVDEAEEPRALFRPLDLDVDPIDSRRAPGVRPFDVLRPLRALPRRLHGAIRDGVGRNADQPGSEGDTAPLEVRKRRERLVEDLRRQLLGRVAVADAPGDKRINAIEVPIVEIGELRTISLRGLDERAIVLHRLWM